MKKVIIINWRWKNLPNQFVNMKVKDKDDCVCCFVDYNQNKIKDFLRQLKLIKADSQLLLLHKSDENGILKGHIKDFKGYIDEFEGGLGNVYKREDNGKKGIIDPDLDYIAHKANFYNNEIIPWENFDFVWKSYCEVKPLEEQKKKLINLWLPLAIDLQGLKDDNKKNLDKYFNEIKNDVSEYVNEDFLKSWDALKNSLPQEVRGFFNIDVPSKVVESLKDDETTAENFYKDYIEKSQGNSFLPNWLQEVVNILDSKNKHSSSEKSK